MAPILIQSATVVRGHETLTDCDVLVVDGKIAEVGPRLASIPEGTRSISASGKIVIPGLFDACAHLRQPGREDAETILSGSRAALRGGITGMVVMPDTSPPIDNGGAVESVRDLIKKLPSKMDVLVAGCISKRGKGEELAELGDMQDHGAVFMTDDPAPIENPLLLRRALHYARNLGILIATSCDIRQLSANGCMNEGPNSYRLGLPGLPACSEEICLARDLRLAQSVDSTIHINQISSARGVETVARYKKDLPFTVGVNPLHLMFTDDVLVAPDTEPYDTNWKVNPPLRTESDRLALLDALRDDKFGIDLIATNHSPWTEYEKERDFASAPFGITGLETSLVAIYHHLIATGQLDWQTLVKRFCIAPRRLVKQIPNEIAPGKPANFVLFNPAATTHFDIEGLASMSKNTPFVDKTLNGRVDLVILGTRAVYNSTTHEL
jgi:dihydroorotase